MSAEVAQIFQSGQDIALDGRLRRPFGEVLQLIPQFENDSLRRLLPHTGNCRKARQISSFDRSNEILHGPARKNGDGKLRSDTRNGHQSFEDEPFTTRGESVKGNHVLTDVRMDIDRNIGAGVRQRRKSREGNEDFVAHAIHIDNNASWILLRQFSSEVGDHSISTRSTTPITAASIGESVCPTEVIAEKPS